MQLSVIVSTCNYPAWLEKALWGYTRQRHRSPGYGHARTATRAQGILQTPFGIDPK